MTDESVERYNEILAEIERRLSNQMTPMSERRELKEIKIKMKIMGPTFLRAEFRRIRAMFDKKT